MYKYVKSAKGWITLKKLKQLFMKIIDFYEVQLPAVLLSAVVILFFAQIVIRYVFNGDTFYVYEGSIICFCWTSIVGASYGFRYKREYGDGHVRFSILSDLLKGKANLWLQVLLSALTVVGMAILFVPSCHTVSAYSISKTTIMHIPFSYIYFPFLIFLVLTAVHEVYSIVVNLRKIFGNTNGLADPAPEKSDNWEG